MSVVVRILCNSYKSSREVQRILERYGVRWDTTADNQECQCIDRLYLMVCEYLPNKFVLQWAPLEDFARETAVLVHADIFTQHHSIMWDQLLQEHRALQLTKVKTTGCVPLPVTNVWMPEEFIATKYPGYFWNTKTRRLYTAKLGVLRQLKISMPNQWNNLTEPAYRVSHEGKRRQLMLSHLNKLTPSTSIFPVEFVTTKSNTNDDVAVNLGQLPPGTRVRVIIEG